VSNVEEVMKKKRGGWVTLPRLNPSTAWRKKKKRKEEKGRSTEAFFFYKRAYSVCSNEKRWKKGGEWGLRMFTLQSQYTDSKEKGGGGG